ncbi:MAG: hypothetical protein SynsKO_43750 [Synoicihabitans sp.]
MNPKKTNPLYQLLSPTRAVGATLAVLLSGTASLWAADEVLTAPPVYVGTIPHAPTWTTIEELKKAADEGEAIACFQYAQLLEVGDQVEKDEAAALSFYRKAAFMDHAEALFRVGKIYHDGLLGQTPNRKLGYEYYEKAAYAGSPEATYNIGAMLVSGRGVKRDYEEGLAWLLLAAERGTDPGSIEQVKKRLSRFPDRITRAEKRFVALKKEITGDNPPDKEKPLAPPAPTMAKPTIAAPTIAAPALPGLSPSTTGPKISAPTFSIPKPTPTPKPTPPESSP